MIWFYNVQLFSMLNRRRQIGHCIVYRQIKLWTLIDSNGQDSNSFTGKCTEKDICPEHHTKISCWWRHKHRHKKTSVQNRCNSLNCKTASNNTFISGYTINSFELYYSLSVCVCVLSQLIFMILVDFFGEWEGSCIWLRSFSW